MIKNVIFDIGRVLFSYEPYDYIMSYGYDEKTSKEIFNIVFDDYGKCLQLDRGIISEEEFLNTLLVQNPNYCDIIKEVLSNWDIMLKPIQETIDFYINLKEKGYKIYLLSNFSKVNYEKLEKQNEFLRFADGKIISYEVKTIKPEKKIYELLLSKYNLIPQECIFIDDRKENIISAKNLGINGIQFKDIKTTIKIFEECIKNY